jgi:hypothetical protein
MTGLAAYVTSFFLPAIADMVGWKCAGLSLMIVVVPAAFDHLFPILVILSGLANLVVIAYVCRWVFGQRETVRWKHALSAALLAAASCVAVSLPDPGGMGFSGSGPQIHVGYVVWISSIFLLAGGELAAAIRARQEAR